MLDDRLIDVIKKKGGSFLVTGPPGSGKTHTLLELVGYLINDRKINPEKLLVFCFNRRWSKLIREKTTYLINSSIFEIPIETFYSFCTRFIEEAKVFLYGDGTEDNKSLKRNSGDNPFGQINILNSVQQWKLLKEVIKKLDKRKYPHTYRYINHNPYIENSYIQEVFDFILRAQENLFTPGELLRKFTPFSNPALSELAGIYMRYVEELKKNQLYNYGMLLEETVSLLKSQKEIRDYYKDNYEYILVDELHEVNKAQFEIINYISNSNCIFFGNDDQSIYSFRGSTTNIFKSVYSSLDSKNIFFLNKNYRSIPVINGISKKFISMVGNRIPGDSSVSDSKSTGELHVKEFHTLLEEANYICRRIKFLFLSRDIRFEEMAIIVKGLGYETHIIENALLHNGIPFLRRGTRSILDNGPVRYLLDFLRFLVALRKVEDTGRKITEDDKNSSKPNYKMDKEFTSKMDNLLENVVLSESINLEPLYFKKIKGAYLESVTSGGGFSNLWDYLKGQCARENKRSGEHEEISKVRGFISEVYKLAGVMERKDAFGFLLELIRNKKAGVIKLLTGGNNKVYKKNQWSNVSDFLSDVKDFCANNTPDDVESYINFIDYILESKFTEEIEESTKDIIQEGSVSILSFHQCKGLEFRAVFIPFINKNYLPAKFTFTQAFDVQIFNYLNGAKILEPEEVKREHLYNEMRLFYNGITRAGEYLCITSSGRGKSIFFENIKDIYKNLGPEYKEIKSSGCNGYIKEKEKEDSKKKPPADKKKFKPGILSDLDLNNMWLVRKKALVTTTRIEKNLKVRNDSYLDRIIILKYFYSPREWWNFIEPTKNNKNPFSVFPLSFSYSGINTFRECPFKYKIKYYFSLKEEENLSLIIGKIYHQVIKLFFDSKNKKDFSWERLRKIIEVVFDRFNFEFEFLKRDLKQKALIQFKNFFENQMPLNPHESIVEKGFSFSLNGEKITGRIDQINFSDKENIELVEYKSSSSSYSEKQLREELQLKMYRLALSLGKDFGDFKSMGVKMKYIFPGDLKKPVAVVADEYYESNEIKDILRDSIAKIKKEEFNAIPKNYNACLNCGFKVLCPKYYG